MLEFHHVHKSYGGAEPILSIDSQILHKGIYWLQGPNGAGKTTLLRMIAGILPFQGDIVLHGHSQRREPVNYRRKIGWADAEPLYPGFLTGTDLLTFYGSILHPEPAQITQLTRDLAIGAWLNTRLADWSSGMIKKLSLLLAFLGQPALITLDEPLITLDETGLKGLIGLIRDYHDRYETSFLLSSHQPIPEELENTHQLTLESDSIQLKT